MKNLVPSISPWLNVHDGKVAIAFYQQAFDAREVYHLDAPDGNVVSRLSVEGAEFWISGGSGLAVLTDENPPVRIILTVGDPDRVFKKAVAAGAIEIFPVGEEHGWRLGRIEDPFGHHWEIGYQIS